MIGISRFIKGKRLENKLLGYNNTFKASIKRFQPGEIPEVLKYDRPYGFSSFINIITHFLPPFRNREIIQWSTSL